MRTTPPRQAPWSDPRRTFLQSLRHYTIEFGLPGVLLVLAGLALFLLPLSIYSYQALQRRSPTILAFLGLGVALPSSAVVPPRAPSLFRFSPGTISCRCFLQIVNYLSMTEASYVANMDVALLAIMVGKDLRAKDVSKARIQAH
jgi:hypothetical protein